MNISEHIHSIRYRKVIEDLHGWLKVHCSTERYEHIQRVTHTCIALAPRFGVSRVHARLVGLAHDMVREWDDQRLTALAHSAGHQLTDMEKAKPLLLHGRCAAILLRRKYGVHNRSIARALEHHTLGAAGMDMLAILLFVSDYLEPGRKYHTREFRRRVWALSPWEIVLAVNDHARARGKKVSPMTLELDEYARKMAGLMAAGETTPEGAGFA